MRLKLLLIYNVRFTTKLIDERFRYFKIKFLTQGIVAHVSRSATVLWAACIGPLARQDTAAYL